MMHPADLLELARPEVRLLPAYNAGLSSEVVRSRFGVENIARLASNENPFGASPAVSKALSGLASEAGMYPDARCTSLRHAIAARLDCPEDTLVLGNGSEEILRMLCEAFLKPGDRVLTQRPTFGLHEIYPKMMGATLQLLALDASLGFDVNSWCDALARGPKMAFIANPSNPVGCMFTTEALARLIDAASPHTLVVIDEAYVEYARHAPDFPDVLALLRGSGKPWIVLRTFSKAWGLAGLRIGYGIASEGALAQLLDRVRTPFNVNRAAQVAALAAWGDEAFMKQAVAKTVELREVLARQLGALDHPNLRIAPSATNFLFIDTGRLGVDVSEKLMAKGIIVKPWKDPGFETFIRISIGTPEDNARVVEAMRAMN